MLKECKESGDGDNLEIKTVKVKQLGTLKTRSSERWSKRKKSGRSSLFFNYYFYIFVVPWHKGIKSLLHNPDF